MSEGYMTDIFGGVKVSDDKIPTSVSFSKKIELLTIEKHISTIDAVLEACVTMSIDFKTANNLLSKSLREKVRIEASRKRLIKDKITPLPI